LLLGDLLGFLVAVLALIASPGPATLSLAATGAAFGVRGGGPYLFELLSGVTLLITGVAVGIVAAVLAIPRAAEVLTVMAVAYLAYLAYRIATAAPVDDDAEITDAPGFATGFVLALLNPKAYAAFIALFSGFDLIPSAPILSTALKAALISAMIVPVNIAWLFAGSALRHLIHDPRTSRLINIGFAFLLILSVAIALAP
jgi:threonine/homoserine/homoserine lactone efflux protein